MAEKHNVASMAIVPGEEFKLTVTLSDGGSLRISGENAIPCFFTIANLVTDQRNDEEPMH